MTNKQNPDEGRKGKEVGVAAINIINVDHTYTPTHVFQLRDTLADQIRVYGHNIAAANATDIAERMLSDRLINMPELNLLMQNLGGDRHQDAVNLDRCQDHSCDGPRLPNGHNHGEDCNHLCSCGLGR